MLFRPLTPRRFLLWFSATALAVLRLAAGDPYSTPVWPSPDDWPAYLGADTRTRYSPLAQIAPENVARLVPVWSYRDGDGRDAKDALPWRSNPLVVDGILFAVTSNHHLVALNAATGTENWRLELTLPANTSPLLGLARTTTSPTGRLFVRTSGHLLAVDDTTGKPTADFGRHGRVTLPATAASEPPVSLSPPTVLDNLVLVTGPGIHAFDTATGAPTWTADVAIDPSRGIATDNVRHLIYAATDDGGLICLRGHDGHLVWQRPLPEEKSATTTPVVFTFHRDGRSIPALAQSTTAGSILLFDRLTGDSLLSAPDGFSVVPPEDAKGAAEAPAIDPDNAIYLGARGLPFASAELASQAIRWRSRATLSQGNSGPIVTGGSVVFRATDTAIEGIDARSGNMLWTRDQAAGSAGTPATYRVNGRQYLVVPSGDNLSAYALPEDLIAKPKAVPRPFERFENEIRRIEKRLTEHPPAPGGIAFLGSSTFTRWDVATAFPELPVTNLGFGGSQIRSINHFIDRILPPVQPSVVVFYCGNNDIGANFSFGEVIRRYRVFTAWMDEHLPETHVVILSNLPTPRRWSLWPDLRELNRRLALEAAAHPRHHYIDGTAIMLDPDGRLRRDRISSDNLHMNSRGNTAMADTLRPVITGLWRQLQTAAP